MKPLSKGDPCRVRLHTGDVVEAVYEGPMTKKAHHFVRVKGVLFSAGKYGMCRFVGNPCVLAPVGVSV